MRLLLLVVAAALLALSAMLPSLADGQSLADRIERERGELGAGRERAGVLVGDIRAVDARIAVVRSELVGLGSRRIALQRELDGALVELSRIQGDLRNERARLARLRARLAQARATLSRRLVDLYKADNPDALSVVLNADGFVDLLERSEFSRRIARQDGTVIDRVSAAKADAVATERRLAALKRAAGTAAEAIERRRDAIVLTESTVDARRDVLERERARKRAVLTDVRRRITNSVKDLAGLEREQARVQARLASVAAVGTTRQSSGDFAWPTDGTVTSGFGPRWGRLHAGLDIAVPEGTPVRAAAAGRVEISAWTGGYGNYVCIQHDGGLSSCYAHNQRLVARVGQQVGKGQLIAASGNTGNSTGPHVHFETRVGGVPRDPLGYL